MKSNAELMKAIKYHRENLDFTSTQVANAIGYDVSKYSRLENNKQYILGIELIAIAEYFGMTVDELIKYPHRKKN
ncbi:helix-turn-helix domain-containing protein [Macrococcus brunensis]|uniref:helix-turn-helix domain-containing protein n=1 Tax=Macrococcus brunensis TaxID=198483 RepID=UPI001EEFDB36|nr:helix-turn-helix transcriptional regulator [Macrococcus brunensis]ULG71391.1 helix-turn-helix domain-containing protein [Macrococcus brunensis]